MTENYTDVGTWAVGDPRQALSPAEFADAVMAMVEGRCFDPAHAGQEALDRAAAWHEGYEYGLRMSASPALVERLAAAIRRLEDEPGMPSYWTFYLADMGTETIEWQDALAARLAAEETP